MLKRLFTILEMIKFGHSIFALPFAVLAAVIAADGWMGWGRFGLIVGCMVLARNVAMTYNRLADAEIDKQNPRTADRAIPKGLVSRGWAMGFITVNAAGFVLVCGLFWIFFRNLWPVVFSIPVLGYLCWYSHLKRYTWLCHFWLGGAHTIAVLAGFIAVRPAGCGVGGVLLALAVGAWTAGFDIIYSTLDVDFDRQFGLSSLPAKIGLGRALWVSRILHAFCIMGFAGAGYLLGLGWIFGGGVILTAGLLGVEHRLVKPEDLRRVNVAFFTVNGVVSVVLASLGIMDILFMNGK
jgi:4-hydroxybenzoate polyprenyltransferase